MKKIFIFIGIAALLIVPLFITAKDGNKIIICHATGSETNPFVEITISVTGLNGHMFHEGDIIPAPEEGCDVLAPVPDGPFPL